MPSRKSALSNTKLIAKEHWEKLRFSLGKIFFIKEKFRGVYSAQDSFFSPAAIFYFFPLLVFSSKEGDKMEKSFQNSLFYSYYALFKIFFCFFSKEGRKIEKKNAFSPLHFYIPPPPTKPHIFFFFFRFKKITARGQFLKYIASDRLTSQYFAFKISRTDLIPPVQYIIIFLSFSTEFSISSA